MPCCPELGTLEHYCPHPRNSVPCCPYGPYSTISGVPCCSIHVTVSLAVLSLETWFTDVLSLRIGLSLVHSSEPQNPAGDSVPIPKQYPLPSPDLEQCAHCPVILSSEPRNISVSIPGTVSLAVYLLRTVSMAVIRSETLFTAVLSLRTVPPVVSSSEKVSPAVPISEPWNFTVPIPGTVSHAVHTLKQRPHLRNSVPCHCQLGNSVPCCPKLGTLELFCPHPRDIPGTVSPSQEQCALLS